MDGVDTVDRVTLDLHSQSQELPETVCWSYQFSSLLTLHLSLINQVNYLHSEIIIPTFIQLFYLDSLVQSTCWVNREQGRDRFGKEEGKRFRGLVYLFFSKVSNPPYYLSAQTRSTFGQTTNNNVCCSQEKIKKEEKKKKQIAVQLQLSFAITVNMASPSTPPSTPTPTPPPPLSDEADKIGSRSPPAFRNFACATSSINKPSSQEKTETCPSDTLPSSKSSKSGSLSGCKFDIGGAATSTPVHSSLNTTSHQCERKNESSNNISASRHDDAENDTLNSDDPEDHGVIEDTENDGDSDIIRKKASGTSNITSDLDQLNQENSPDHDMVDVPSVPVLDGIEQATAEEDTKHVEEKIPYPPENERDDEIMNANDTERRPDISDVQRAPKDDYTLDTSSSSYGPPSSPDERGKAGLDPDYSSEWVPYMIDPEKNLSKSKKRRRRQKRRQEELKKRDSLGKLLAGKQTKEDEESISTYDHGSRNSTRVQDHDGSGICEGALLNNQRHVEDPMDEEEEFSASLNSTQYGQDFDSHSFLRGEPEKDVPLQEDFEDIDAADASKIPHDNPDDTINEPTTQKDAGNDSHSSNSTSGKRRRRRQRKIAEKKQKQDNPENQVPNMETRSRKQQQQPPHRPDVQDNVQDDHDHGTSPILGEGRHPREQIGEKEKNPSPSAAGALQVIGDQQISVFKRPDSCSRSEIQRLVSKAVFKARAKTSTAFTFNSKIQNFQISTNSADVIKVPDIDESAPLVELTIPEFIWPQEDKTLNNVVNVKSRGVIQFVILVKSAHTENDLWDTPQIDRVRNFASYLMCTIAELKLEFGNVLRWTNAWGNTAIMGLDSSDLDMLLKFRTFFTTLRYFHQFINNFPKDALTNNHALTVLLRSDLREFKEIYLAEALFARNKLFGILDTLQAETYTAADTTRAGVSKNGWRNVLLEGDQEFLESLSEFPPNHWFNIGPATVQIHGGDRRAETPAEIEAKNKRKRFNMPAGQNLTSSAKASIDKSFMEEQRARIQAKQPIARAQSQSYASKTGTTKKKKQ